MTHSHRADSVSRHRQLSHRERQNRALTTVAAALGLFLAIGSYFAPTEAARSATLVQAYTVVTAQDFTVSPVVEVAAISRSSYGATVGVTTLVRGGTNRDWAKLVMLDGGWEMSDNNVTVFLRWMRQENGTNNWWNRNNPLNNGWGSGGGGGTGTYANLQVAAAMCADALKNNPGYAGIVSSFARSTSPDATAQRIWASPWASGHYANGDHWSTAKVPIVSAPASAWG
jgi:hypothetical protein